MVLDSLRNAGGAPSLILKATSAIRTISSFGPSCARIGPVVRRHESMHH